MSKSGKKKEPAYLDPNAVKAVFRPHGLTDNMLEVQLSVGQRAVQALGFGDFARVIGSPQSGKTTALKALFLELAKQDGPDSIMVFAGNRTSAATLRDELALAFQGASSGPMARTIPSLAFAILREHALQNKTKLPELITGSEQDAIIEDILSEVADGALVTPAFPKGLTKQSLRLRGVRAEIRELISVAIEHDISAEGLAALAAKHGEEVWAWGASIYDVYLRELAEKYNLHRFDPTSLVVEATRLITDGKADSLLAEIRIVLVDDAQELTPATTNFLRALCARGASAVLFGDPDVATLGFRSGDPEAMTRLVVEFAAMAKVEPKLIAIEARAGAHSDGIAAALSKVTERIGAALAGTQRAPISVTEGVAGIEAAAFALRGDEHAWLARRLRDEHLNQGVAWRDMAVVARSADELVELEAALAAESVPIRLLGAKAALKDQFASASLLHLIEAVLSDSEIEYPKAVELLESPVGDFDTISLRRLRRALRLVEVEAGGSRNSHELICAMFVDREWLNELDIPIIKKAAKFITLFFDMRELAAKPETTIQDLLWAAFQRSQMKKVWPHQAMVVEEVGLQTARNLDAVVALFGAAARYVERNPKGEAIEFVRQQLALRLPEDSIGVGANLEHRVSLVTPSGLIGRHYRVLAIAHLQEGIWPNLRPRSSLLKATALDELVRTNADKVEARQSQNEMPGELRMLAKAIGATGERLYLSAIATEEEQPSQFFELVAQHVPEASELTETPLTMRAMAGRLRKELVREGDPVRRQVIAAQLVRLAAAGAPGADPAQWWGLAKPTTDEPLAELGLGNKDSNALVIKPSELESFARCPLHWFIEAHGGSSYSFKTRVGDLMHEILELPGAPDRDRYFEVVESKWPELEFDSNWQERHERERVTLMVNRLYNYLNQYEADGNQKVYAEESFEFEIGGAHVKGRADRIEVLKDGSLRVADLKTSKYSVKVKDVPNHQQLGAYQLAVLNNAFPKIAEAISEPILEGAQLIEIGAKDPVGDPLLEQADLKPQASLQVDLTAREQMVGEITEAIQGMLMQQGFLVAKAGEHCRSDYSFGSCEIHLIEQVTYGD